MTDLTEAMMTLSCDAELSTKLSSLEDFVVVSHSFFVSVVIIVHVGQLSFVRRIEETVQSCVEALR